MLRSERFLENSSCSPSVSTEHRKKYRVASVIVVFNGEEWIEKCITSLDQSSFQTEIILVDNGSKDNTLNRIAQFPEIEVVKLRRNLGFGKANNIGIKIALERKAEYVFLLNQDAYVTSDAIEKLIRGMAENPALGILSPLHLNAEGDAIDANFARYLVTKGAAQFYSDLLFGHRSPGTVYFMNFANAAAWMLSAKCIRTVGGFDPLFHMYGEDVDYCRRVLRNGFRIGMLPEAVIYHARGKAEHFPAKKNRWQTILALYSQEKSRSIVELKAPGNFLRISALWCAEMFYKMLRAVINREICQLAAQVLVTFHLLLLLPRILAHRHQDERLGPTWL